MGEAKLLFGFSKAYDNRSINNLYFDSKRFDAFEDNVEGYSDRSKLRIRWYGSKNIVENPVLEIKTKKNTQGFKTFCDVKKFDINNIPNITELLYNDDSNIRYHIYQASEPSIINSYDRQYYSNRNQIRVTIDTNIRYKKPNKFNSFISHGSYAILEIKYESKNYKKAEKVLSSLPNALEKNSKYVIGTSGLYYKEII